MSLKVIELNDRAIGVGDDSGERLLSPGFALVDAEQLMLGEQAEKQARLRPTDSFNKFWHELNLEQIKNSHSIRHHADIAYAHLQHLAAEAGLNGDVIIAVPGSFSRQQLSILLGLIRHCPFQLVGMVDSALMATAAFAMKERADGFLYADLQLHQTVITQVDLEGSRLQAGAAVQIPGVGSQHFIDQLMQISTGMFIQQCRFNPCHNAESEQQLYNQLPGWLAQAQRDSNLLMELATGDMVHTARMPMDSLKSSLGVHFTKIKDQIAAMSGSNDTRLVLNPALAELPGFKEGLVDAEYSVIKADTINSACYQHSDLIIGDPQGISVVKSLPIMTNSDTRIHSPVAKDNPNGAETGTPSNIANPTHVLLGHKALPVNRLSLQNRKATNGDADIAGTLVLSVDNQPEQLGMICGRDDGIYIDTGGLDYWLNGEAVTGQHKLAAGDRIQFEGSFEVLTMIQVPHVQ
ncbi:MAG: hypothetical protein OXD01_05710 [Gammaproteobacteria bacterium]|nr:hypothetical protein [Gammaproteobacteria bacterium]